MGTQETGSTAYRPDDMARETTGLGRQAVFRQNSEGNELTDSESNL